MACSPPTYLLKAYCNVPCCPSGQLLIGAVTVSKGKSALKGHSPHASVMVVSFGGACPFFGQPRNATLTPKNGHHSHFLKDSFC